MATARTTIGPADDGVAMSLDDFLDAEMEEGYRYELADGVVVVIDIPEPPHFHVVHRLYRLASDYERDHPGIIEMFGAGSDVRVWKPGGNYARHPDLSIIFPKAPKGSLGNQLPALIAEVVSPSGKRRDCVEKRRHYLGCAIHEYWIVDPTTRQVTQLTRERLEEPDWDERILTGDQRLTSSLLPGLDEPITGLWIDLSEDEMDD